MKSESLLCSVAVLFSFIILTTLASNCGAQDYIYATGNPTFSSNVPVEHGFINVSNGNLHLEIPLATHHQRGALHLSERLVYDSRIWKIVQNGGYSWQPVNVPNSMAGWRFVTGQEAGSISYTSYVSNQHLCICRGPDCATGQKYYDQTVSSIYSWVDPSGTIHKFDTLWPVSFSPCDDIPLKPQSRLGWATDATGYSIALTGDNLDVPTSVIIKDSNGSQVYPTIIDRFGNYWSKDASGNLVDDLGRTPVIVSSSGYQVYYDVLTVAGARARYTVTTSPISTRTHFSQSAVSEFSGSLTTISSILLPDGSSYSFTYDSGTTSGNYGELTSVTLPQGGTIYYGYSNYFDSYQNVNRWLSSRTIGGGTTTFTPSVLTQCSGSQKVGCQEQVVLHKPSGDETQYTLTLNNGSWNTAVELYSGPVSGGTALIGSRPVYDFSHSCDGIVCQGAEYVSKSTDVRVLPTGVSSQKQYAYANPQTGQLTSLKEWDYNSGSPPVTPTRETDYSYSGLDLTQVKVLDGTGAQASLSSYTYGPSAVQTSGVVGHGTANAGGPYLLSSSVWLNTDNSNLVTQFTYDDTGAVLTQTNPNNNPATTFNYDPSRTFLIKTTRPTTNGVAHVSTTTYDASTGLVLNSQDESQQGSTIQTNHHYDSIGRATQVDVGDGNATFYAKTTYAYPNHNETDVSVYQSSSVATTTATILDQYGRPYQKVSGPITSETYYDANGRVSCLYTPHTSTDHRRTASRAVLTTGLIDLSS